MLSLRLSRPIISAYPGQDMKEVNENYTIVFSNKISSCAALDLAVKCFINIVTC